MQVDQNGPIKIGIAFNVERRRRQAQTFHHKKVVLLGQFPGNQSIETTLLKRFSTHQINGEWFQFSDELYNLARGIFNVQYAKEGDKNYLLLFRETEWSKTDPCPFCFAQHSHGIGDGHRIAHCLKQVGHPSIRTTDGVPLNRDDGYIIKTRNLDSPPPNPPTYRRVSNTRRRILENLLTYAANSFLERGIFTLDPQTAPPTGGVTLLLDYPDGTPCKIQCYNAGYGEIGIQILYGIKISDPPVYTFISRQSKEICSAHAAGWLERKEGKHLQIPVCATSLDLYCENHASHNLANLEIQPMANSFVKTGPFRL